MPAPLGHPPYNKNGEGGRPPRFTLEFIENEAEELYKWMHAKQSNVFVEWFCYERGYSDKKISDFVKQSERFKEVYELFKTKQKASMFQGAVTRQLYYPGCSLVLCHHHGIVTKTEQKVISDVVHPLAFAMEGEGETKELVNE